MAKGNPWAGAASEPLVADLLSDPIAQALMRADGVIVGDVFAIVTRIREAWFPLIGFPSIRASGLGL